MAAELPLKATSTVRRAWLVLAGAFSVFSLLLAGVVAGIYVYRGSATRAHEAVLEFTGEVLLQPHNETRFKPVRTGDVVRQGDTISTQAGGQARLVFFDGSELRLAQDTSVQVKEMRATRFVANEARIVLVQSSGWSRLAAAPATDYRVGRIQTVLDTLEIETESTTAGGAELSFEVRPVEPRQNDPLEAVVAVQSGTALVQAAGEQVRLSAGQKTSSVRMGRAVTPPAAPSPAVREYIRNGDFQILQQAGSNLWPRYWVDTSQGEGHGDASVENRQINGQAAPVILLRRRVNATEPGVAGISQELNLPLSHFRTLRLRVQLRVIYHSLSGGGIEGSEYPIIVKLTYRDRQNRANQWIWGFFTHNEERLRVDRGIMVETGEWEPFERSLLDLSVNPPPVLLETIDIYAAGHDFEAEIASVSITGE